MSKHTISFAKVFSPPSATAWAQTYHAGNVYTVVSVTQEALLGNPEHAIPSVHVLGKDIINNLEAEYFAIATKTLDTMKEAVVNACKEIPDNASATVIFGVIQNNILYIFLYGHGHVYIKRGEKFGSLLETVEDTKQVVAISGLIQPSDKVVLATDQFIHAVSSGALEKQLIHTPAEVAEAFSQQLDDEQYAGAAAIIFSIEGDHEGFTIHTAPITQAPDEEKKSHPEAVKPVQKPIMQTVEEDDEQSPSPSDVLESKDIGNVVAEKPIPTLDTEEKMDLDEKPHFETQRRRQKQEQEEKPKRKLPKPSLRQTFFLLVAITLAGILGTSIFVTQHKQQNTQAQTMFSSQFPSAKQKYDEGQSLLSLNKNLAQDDFSKAKTILEGLKAKTPADSSDAVQVKALLDKVNQALGSTTTTQPTSLKQSDTSVSKLLSAEIATPGISYFSQDATTVYSANGDNIASIDNDNKVKPLIKNDSDWTDVSGFGTYLGNFYLLDKKADQIHKFTKASDGFGKTNYFSDKAPVLTQAEAITIDGSIWILSSEGSIMKFTKGKQDQFTIGKLDKPLNHPTRIVTTADIDNIYILDNGNARVVVLKKDDGSVVQQYRASELQKAKDIDVDEKNKKIYILVDSKIFEIAM
ncbi:MAG TPA: hypothetical protein VLF89_00520 [Candidatus Saccharimonadales bacterium]|nr:hypothetical protein [Candidatus Saccharimonadales bacterium]